MDIPNSGGFPGSTGGFVHCSCLCGGFAGAISTPTGNVTVDEREVVLLTRLFAGRVLSPVVARGRFVFFLDLFRSLF